MEIDQIKKKLASIKYDLIRKNSSRPKKTDGKIKTAKLEYDEFNYATPILTEGRNFFQKWSFKPGESQLLDNPNIRQWNTKEEEIMTGKAFQELRVLENITEENSQIFKLNNLQKSEIDRLQSENESIKKQNLSLIAQSESNTKYLNDIIDVLQKKICELNLSLEAYQLNTMDIEKRNILQLIDIVKYIPKQLYDANILQRSPNVQFEPVMLRHAPMLKNQVSSGKHEIIVICRVRPDPTNCVIFPSNKKINLPQLEDFENTAEFQFSRVFDGKASQVEVFNEISDILPYSINDFNVCLIGYGLSETGKTHTMIGSNKDPGIMLLSVKELMKLAINSTSVTYKLHLTIMELYNDQIYDLIKNKSRTNPIYGKSYTKGSDENVQIKDVSETVINKLEEFNYYIRESLKRRNNYVAARSVNCLQSHYFVMVRIIGVTRSGPMTNRGSLIMCDLAGSETNNGQQNVSEIDATFVDRSISKLSYVFDMMYRKLPAIPYRDTALNQLLKQSFIRDSKCIFIATVSGKPEDINDTYQSLNVAKQIELIHCNNKKIDAEVELNEDNLFPKLPL